MVRRLLSWALAAALLLGAWFVIDRGGIEFAATFYVGQNHTVKFHIGLGKLKVVPMPFPQIIPKRRT